MVAAHRATAACDVFRYSRDRTAIHPTEHLAGFSGLLQADAYAAYNKLYEPDRRPGPITGAFCLGHARRKFFVLADIAASARRGPSAPPISPLALDAVRRLDRIFALEREINCRSAAERLAFRREHVVLLVAELEACMRRERTAMSKHAPMAKAMDYMLTRWDGFVRDPLGPPRRARRQRALRDPRRSRLVPRQPMRHPRRRLRTHPRTGRLACMADAKAPN